jgi:EAL and modified HD-GYP domain-containing signal transduction protein
MLGLFSLLHAMLDTPIKDILSKIPVSDDIKGALTHQRGPLAIFLTIIIAYERGSSEVCFQALETLHIPKEKLYLLYLSSLEFADTFVNL